MPEKSIQELLSESFPKATKENWKQAASVEINGADPLQKLLWIQDGLSFLPYYGAEDVIQLEYLQKFQHKPSLNSFLGAQSWLNLPKVKVNNEIVANQMALDHLANGGDGILFDLSNTSSISLDKLLNNIEWPHCAISFYATATTVFNDLPNYIATQGYHPDSITGNCFWESEPKNGLDIIYPFLSFKNYKSLGLVIKASTPVQEILDALQKGVQLIDELSEKKNDLALIFNSMAFSLPVGTNFFLEIAKFKVLRMLWFQIAQAYGVKDYQPSDLHLHARSESCTNEKYQPHGNLLKSTTATMASILGGCNSITVHAEDEENVMLNRMARNVSNILREESHFSKVADPLAGSYALENMVNEMAQKVWGRFINA